VLHMRVAWMHSMFLVLCLGSSRAPLFSMQAVSSTDQFVDAQRQDLARNPAGLTFTIRLKDHANSFHQGEIIPLELSFSSTLPMTYQLDGGLYDRSGRLEIDKYVIDMGEDATDPLRDYQPGIMAFGACEKLATNA